jgi:UDP-N-acetylmuramate dehydrogenase
MTQTNSEILTALSRAAKAPVLENHSLSGECSFRLGGAAQYFCNPATADTLRAIWLKANELSLPVFILGGGSNVLFKDEGFPGVVISTKNMRRITATPEGLITAGAGALNTDLTSVTMKVGLTGFEWASGLPGTLGGGVFMNAKCYGHSYADVVKSVKAFKTDGTWLTLSAPECHFAYKDSVFQHSGYIIVELELFLTPGDPSVIQALTRKTFEDRQKRGQFLYPSAGCVFKNAYSLNTPAGKLIEDCGLKGYSIGGAKVYEKHANFIINSGSASAKDITDLIAYIKEKVKEKHNYQLEEELRVV